MTLNIKALVDGAYNLGVSDIHIVQDSAPYMRIDGIMRTVQSSPVSGDDLKQMLEEIMPDYVKKDLEERRGADFAYQPDDRMRFRVSAYYERDRLRLVMRLIKMEIATLDELGLPPVLHTVTTWYRGMVLMTGVTGSGAAKSWSGRR